MAYTTIDKPTDYFRTKLYSGNGTNDTSITFDETENMQPDWTWIKQRTSTQEHWLADSVRGADKFLESNSTNAEVTITDGTGFDSFDTNGFTVSTSARLNASSNTYVAWNWLAGGTASSNTDGSITSSVSANTTAGFSIVSLSGTGSNLTAGHGLGVAPSVIILKARNIANNWLVYHKDINAQNALFLDRNVAKEDNSIWFNDTEPTSSVFSLGTWSGMNTSSSTVIAYCFAEKKGYSKFGSYTGNGNADGTFVYTGFKPAFVILKRTDTIQDWYMFDNKRDTINPMDIYLRANESGAEPSAFTFFDFLSNGFKCRNSASAVNASGGTYIYMAFAENPFVTSTGIPCTAR